MKIQYASDLHLEFADNSRHLKENPITPVGNILILAGDIGYINDQNYSNHPFWDWASENFQQTLVVLGNHEFYKYYDVSTLPDGHIGTIRANVRYFYNAVVRIENTDFILSTLWAKIDISGAWHTERYVSDFHRILYKEKMLTWDTINAEHERCLSFIKTAVLQSDAANRVVVTHHVPSFEMLSPEFIGSKINGAFTVELGDFIKESNIDYWVYGHSHRNTDRITGNTRCITNQLGYTFHNEHHSFDREKCFEIQ